MARGVVIAVNINLDTSRIKQALESLQVTLSMKLGEGSTISQALKAFGEAQEKAIAKQQEELRQLTAQFEDLYEYQIKALEAAVTDKLIRDLEDQYVNREFKTVGGFVIEIHDKPYPPLKQIQAPPCRISSQVISKKILKHQAPYMYRNYRKKVVK